MGQANRINPLGVGLGVEMCFVRTSPKSTLFEWTSSSKALLWMEALSSSHFLSSLQGIGLTVSPTLWST